MLSKTFPFVPYDTGSQSANTDDILEDIPQLSTLKRNQSYGDDTDYLHKEAANLPNEIKIRLVLKPIPMSPPTITAQLRQDNRLLQICSFYHVPSLHRNTRDFHPSTLWTGIDFAYEGTAFYHQHGDEWSIFSTHPHFQLTYQKDQVIGRYNFVLPDQTHYSQSNLFYKKNYCLTIIDNRIQAMNISPLIPYGSYLERPINVTHVCQTYALISGAPAHKTQLTLYTQHYCNKNGIQLSTPQNVTPFRLCMDPKYLPTVHLTLAGWLSAGYLKITVTCKITNTEHQYHSKSWKQIDLGTEIVDVLFFKSN